MKQKLNVDDKFVSIANVTPKQQDQCKRIK